MWITAFVNIVVYGILFLYFKGHITTNGWHIQLFRGPVPFHALMPLKRVYGLLLWGISLLSSCPPSDCIFPFSYPIVYTLTVSIPV